MPNQSIQLRVFFYCKQKKEGINMIISGFDCGNSKQKVSYLDRESKIHNLEIPTVIAEAPASKIELKSKRELNQSDTGLLHVRIKSDALDSGDRNKCWYVGSYARTLKNRQEPQIINGESEDKFNGSNTIQLVPLLTAMAVIAAKNDDTEVTIPFAGGIPIEEYKRKGEKPILDMLLGKHYIEFIDGVYEGKNIEVYINEGEILVEGITSILAIEFDIHNGQLIKTPIELGNDFAVADLGAGTTDFAVFKDGALNKTLSTNTKTGTNTYIDGIIQNISNHSAFENLETEDIKIFKSRDDFNKMFIQEAEKIIQDETYKPMFNISWGPIRNVDITQEILKGVEEYYNRQKQDIIRLWMETNVDKIVLVGGGLLFAYNYFKNDKDIFTYPKNLKDAPYLTSMSYLIANYSKHKAES